MMPGQGFDFEDVMALKGAIERLTRENERLQRDNAEFSGVVETNGRLTRERDKARAALRHVRAIITDGALTGFNCLDGDWAERLYASQALTHAAVREQSARVSYGEPVTPEQIASIEKMVAPEFAADGWQDVESEQSASTKQEG
jgi:hypothetical protein